MTTATEGRQAPASNGTEPSPTKNLHQRIAAIKKAAKVTLTGTTGDARGNRAAMSGADLDRALSELMAEHGVHSTYDFLDEPSSYEEKSREGTYRVWRVHIRGWLVNVDNPKDDREGAELYDDGTNISGAVSFALKRWQREVFKLAEDDTSAQTHQREGAQSAGGRTERPLCPNCKKERLLRSKPRTDEERANPDKLGWYCWKNEERGKHGCGAQFAVDDPRLTGEIQPEPVSVGNTEAPPLGPDELDPDVKVCPNCGKAEALRRKTDNKDRAWCKNTDGLEGCGAEFDAAGVPTRAEFIEKIGPAQPSRLEQTVAEAGMTPEDTETPPPDDGDGLQTELPS